MSLEQRKATEYMSMLKNKSTEEISSMMDNLRSKLKNERSKPEPDESGMQNLNWQLSLLGRVFSTRKPIAPPTPPAPANPPVAEEGKDRIEQITEQQESEMAGTAMPTIESPLKSKTLDELNKMLADVQASYKKQVEADKGKESLMAFNYSKWTNQINALKAEIATRSPKDKEDAKKDIAKAEGKLLGIDTDVLLIGGISAVIGGAIGWGMEKNKMTIVGFAVAGLAIGGGVTYMIKKK